MGIRFAHPSRFFTATTTARLIDRLPRVLAASRTLTATLLGVLSLAAPNVPAAPFAYVAVPRLSVPPRHDSVSVLDIGAACGAVVVATVPLEHGPAALAVNPAGTRVYVAHGSDGTVSVIDTASNTVIATVPVGSFPFALAVNSAGTRVYVSSNSLLSVIDTGSNTVIATAPSTGGSDGVAVNSAGTRVYVTNRNSNSLSVLDADLTTVIATIEVGTGPRRVAVNPAGTRVYVANWDSGGVTVIDATSNTVIATVATATAASGLAIHPDGTRIYMVDRSRSAAEGGPDVVVLDTASHTIVARVPVERIPSDVAVHPDGTRVYVTNAFSENVSVIDTASNTVIATVPVGSFHGNIGIAPASGPLPAPEPDPTAHLRVTGIEVTQGIQDLANSVPLISGRRTFVRVHVQSDGPTVRDVTATLSGAATSCGAFGGSCVTRQLGSLIPVNTVTTVNAATGETAETSLTHITLDANPKRSNLSDSFLFELPWRWTSSGSLRLHAVLSAGAGPPRQSCPSDILGAPLREFQVPLALKIQFVRLGYRLPGTFNGLTDQLVQTTLAEQQQSESFIRRTYPLTNLLSGPDYYLFDDQLGRYVGQGAQLCLDMKPEDRNQCAHYYITSRLGVLQAISGFTSQFIGGDAEAAYALIPQVPNDPLSIYFTRGACCTNAVASGPADRAHYAAHEILHFLGREHPEEGASVCGHSASDPLYPYALSFIGQGVLGAQTDLAGFDGGDASLGIPRRYRFGQGAFDNIGYCKPGWISDYTYKSLFCMVGFPRNNPSGTVGSACGVPPRSGAGPQMGDWLMVFGGIDPDLATAGFHHVQRVDRVFDVPPRTPGTHSIRLIGAGGIVLADYPFTPEVVEDAQTSGGGSKPLSFGHVVPFGAATQEIQIVDASAGNRVIGSRAVSPNRPVISNVALVGPLDPTGAVAVEWTASDPDGDRLTFDIFLAREGGASLQPLRLGVSETTVQVDTAPLGGGLVQLRVMATDGVHSAFADSPQFNVANKPPRPRILNPGDGGTIFIGQLVNLEGEAADPQDGVIAETGLAWSIPGRSLGSGSRLSITDLPIGVNQVTLTATNSLGVSGTTTVTLHVKDDAGPLGPTLTAGPGEIGWHVGVGESQIQTAELEIGNAGSGTLGFTASSSAAWLTLSATSGNAPATLTLIADPAGFAGGATRRAAVILEAIGIPGQVVTIPVTIAVGNTFVVGDDEDNGPAVSAGTLQFDAADYSVAENAGNASIAVTRAGGSAGAVSVRFTSSNGTASGGADYMTVDTVVSFADGETAAKVLLVPIFADNSGEPDETANLTLSAPTGGAMLGTASSAVLTIVDVPPQPPAPSPSSSGSRPSRGGGALDLIALLALATMLVSRVRMHDIRALGIVVALGLILVGCSRSEAPSAVASSELDAPTGSSTASIEVIGGPMAGNHTLTSSEAACMISKGFELNLGLLATDPRYSDPKTFTLLSVVLQDAAANRPAPHDQYGVGVHFGPLQDDQLETVYVSGAGRTVMRKGGTGTVVLKDDGKNKVEVTLDLQPEAGVVVKGTVRCGNVIRY